MKLTINLTPEEHAALADFLVMSLDQLDHHPAYGVLSKLVNQGAVIHQMNIDHPSVIRVFNTEFSSFRPRKTLLPRARHLGGPGSTR